MVVTGDGAIISRLANGNATVANVAATATPQPDSSVYYDGAAALSWDEDATGAQGIVWIPGIAAGTVSLSLDNGSSQKTVSSIPVSSDTITYVLTTFP